MFYFYKIIYALYISRMDNLSGGKTHKRKVNKSLKAWVTFVKKVQREEKINYKEAIHRAKQRKDKGEKWMLGGVGTTENSTSSSSTEELTQTPELVTETVAEEFIPENNTEIVAEEINESPILEGGKRRRRTAKKRRSNKKGKTARKGRRASRKH